MPGGFQGPWPTGMCAQLPYRVKVLRVSTLGLGNEEARQDKTRQDKTRQDKTRQDKTRQDKTRRDETRQDKTRRDETRRQVKTRQVKLLPHAGAALVSPLATLRFSALKSLIHVCNCSSVFIKVHNLLPERPLPVIACGITCPVIGLGLGLGGLGLRVRV